MWPGSLLGHPSKQDVHGSPDAFSPCYAFLAWQASFAATRPQPAALFLPKMKQTDRILYVMLPWELCNKTRFPWVPTLLSPPGLLRQKTFSSRRRSLILSPTSQQWENSVTEAFVIRGNEPLLITTLIISLIAGIPSFKVIIRPGHSVYTEDLTIVSDTARNKKIQARSPLSFSLHANLFIVENQQRLFRQLFFVWRTNSET
jgi:hypothetical protein